MLYYSMDNLEKKYRSVLSAFRICQLYGYMHILELMTVLYAGIASFAIWMAISFFGNSGPHTADWSFPIPNRSLLDIVLLLIILHVFAVYSQFQRSWLILIVCALGLLYNIHHQYDVDLDKSQWHFGSLNLTEDAENVLSGYLTAVLISHAWFFYIAIRAQRTISRLKISDIDILSEYAQTSPGPANFILAFLGIPAGIRYASRKTSTFFLSMTTGVANFLTYWTLAFLLFLALLLPISVKILLYMYDVLRLYYAEYGIDRSFAFYATISILAASTPILFISLLPVYVQKLSRFCIVGAQNFMRKSLEQVQSEDVRPPILFLRSFLIDRVPVHPRRFSLKQWLLDSRSRKLDLDHILLEEGTRFGPTVALGNPDDPEPPYGVARGYFEDQQWQDAVARLCHDSAAIVICLDRTAGVTWELAHLSATGHTAKTLFLLAPDDVGTETGRTLLSEALASVAHHRPQMSPTQDQTERQQPDIGFWIRPDGDVEILTSSERSAYTYRLCIRRMLRDNLTGIYFPRSRPK